MTPLRPVTPFTGRLFLASLWAMRAARFRAHPTRWLGWGLFYTLLGWGAVHIGNDTPLPDLVAADTYWPDVAYAVLVSLGLGLYLRGVAKRLAPLLRAGQWNKWLAKSALWAVAIPVLFAFVSEWAYLEAVLGIPLAASSMFYLELPLVLAFSAFAYLLTVLPLGVQATKPEMAPQPAAGAGPTTGPKPLTVRQGNATRVVNPADVAVVCRVGPQSVLVLHTHEQLATSLSLDELGNHLPRHFRLNRQLLVSHAAVLRFAATPTRKLTVDLDSGGVCPTAYVSKANAAAFRQWIEQGPAAGSLG